MRTALATCVLLVSSFALAQADDAPDPAERPAGPLVLVNAASRLASLGQVDRLRRVLDQRGLLARLPQHLADVLDGSNVVLDDLDDIKDAYGRQDYATARALIESDEQRLLANLGSGDPMPALAELSQLHGLVEAAEDDDDAAIAWLRAAYRFNPAQGLDKQLASPRIRALQKQARAETAELGGVRVDAAPANAMVRVNGGEAQPVGQRIALPVGVHLVQVTAEGRKPYAELVKVREGRLEKVQVALDPETTQDQAAKLVDVTAAAPAGKARLPGVSGLSRLTGVNRMLLIEDGGDDHVTVRVYDSSTRKVSGPVELEGSAPSALIARKILAALEPDNMIDVTTVMVIERSQPKHWYQHWYVWAGAAVVLGAGGLATYQSFQSPTSIRGFVPATMSIQGGIR